MSEALARRGGSQSEGKAQSGAVPRGVTREPRSPLLLRRTAEQQASGTASKGKVLSPQKIAREKVKGNKRGGKRRERGRQDTQEKEKGHMGTPHALGEGGQKAAPTGGGAEDWRGEPTCISGTTEPLAIYKSVLCKWIDT